MAHSKRPNRTTHRSPEAYKKAMAAWNKAHQPKNGDGTTAKERVDAKQKALDEAKNPTVKSSKNNNKTSKKNNLKVKGIGPVAPDHKDAKAYAKHLNERAKKRKIKGEGPVTDRKKYGETLNKHAAKQEAEAKAKWLKKTRNSPAARAGIGDDKRYNLHKKNKDFQAHKKAGTLDKFAEKYPDSQTAKKRKKRLRIPSPMDMD